VLPFANPRHAHEYRCLKDLPLGDDQVIVAGVIDPLTNFVEHPELHVLSVILAASWRVRTAALIRQQVADVSRTTWCGQSWPRWQKARELRRGVCSNLELKQAHPLAGGHCQNRCAQFTLSGYRALCHHSPPACASPPYAVRYSARLNHRHLRVCLVPVPIPSVRSG
jgi:hypothetical protein